MAATSGCKYSGTSGTNITSSARAATSSSPSHAMAITGPPRALISSRLLITLSNTAPRGMQKHGRRIGVHQGDRAMLHFCRRVTFRMDVADLLELERPFQRHGVKCTAGPGRGNCWPGNSFSAISRTASWQASVRSDPSGMACSCWIIRSPGRLDRWRIRPEVKRQHNQDVTWEVNALVLATPISGPACR